MTASRGVINWSAFYLFKYVWYVGEYTFFLSRGVHQYTLPSSSWGLRNGAKGLQPLRTWGSAFFFLVLCAPPPVPLHIKTYGRGDTPPPPPPPPTRPSLCHYHCHHQHTSHFPCSAWFALPCMQCTREAPCDHLFQDLVVLEHRRGVRSASAAACAVLRRAMLQWRAMAHTQVSRV